MKNNFIKITVLLFILFSHASCTKNWNDVYRAVSGQEKHGIIQQLAEQGDARAQYVLSMHYLRGEFVEQNPQSAEQWLQASAKNGYAESQYKLALRYNTVNEQYTIDHARAINWLKLAAEQGHINAQYELGEHYHRGAGIEKDLELSYIWLTLASRQNSFVASRALSMVMDEMTEQQIVRAKQQAGLYFEKYNGSHD